ncbi:uncharacterized protein CDAR_248481 [Caerostris darwini]|uniref:Endonuclease/exonuclease/phosphatase domain-containing protein n=1 Tax=Caerostris darwini TaxID=1538125 RepID=A0AAV4Q6Z1_9ARAC|nr:uncharacterized protein CDAR_248481 [Caerostris darwini]
MRTINFLQLNINGTQRKVAELSDILHTNNIHVACLQETKLNHKLGFKIKGYTTIRKDRSISTGGGLAFLVKTSDVKYIEVLANFPLHSTTEAQAINILLPEHTITVINAYHPDTAPIDTLFLQDLSSTTAETKIIFGDLNVKSPSWGNNLLDAKRKQIEDLIDDLNLTILNTGEITFVSKTNGTASALDITAISYLSADKTRWRVLESAISDHYPVLTFSMDQDSPVQVKLPWNSRKANWNGFTQELENLCSNLPEQYDLEKHLSLFTRNIRNAAKHYIPRGKRKDI